MRRPVRSLKRHIGEPIIKARLWLFSLRQHSFEVLKSTIPRIILNWRRDCDRALAATPIPTQKASSASCRQLKALPMSNGIPLWQPSSRSTKLIAKWFQIESIYNRFPCTCADLFDQQSFFVPTLPIDDGSSICGPFMPRS
mgnify:CR=1 FL=1